ncbi:hypothetical protein B0H66DRAFT_557206 [Apodospora peruviana]|uniref:Uncharacterized protein n=1 Tax=Apodospora peruviana TaxID=516989 RepID=A0AAE0M4H6_9PEZI|nr:hypothetical protein B0H66DRAFT_557206 [Apodospora peruviana]
MLSWRLRLPRFLTRQRQWQWQWPYQIQPQFQSPFRRHVAISSFEATFATGGSRDPPSVPSRSSRNKLFASASYTRSNAPANGTKRRDVIRLRRSLLANARRNQHKHSTTSTGNLLDKNSQGLPFDFASRRSSHQRMQYNAAKKKQPVPAVLFFRAASSSLVESDFYRLAGQGKHVDGWVLGITKIIQVRSHVSQRPQGRYFLFFDTKASARTYLNEVRRLHVLTRTYIADAWGNGVLEGSVSANQGATVEEKGEEEPQRENNGREGNCDADVDHDIFIANLTKTYTLTPPGSLLQIFPISYKRTCELLRHQKTQHVPRPPAAAAESEHNSTNALLHDQKLGLDAPTGVGDPLHEQHIKTMDLPSDDQNQVLVRLIGAKMTPYALRWAIFADGRSRNLLWRMQSAYYCGRGGPAGLRRRQVIQPLEFSRLELFANTQAEEYTAPVGAKEQRTATAVAVEEQTDVWANTNGEEGDHPSSSAEAVGHDWNDEYDDQRGGSEEPDGWKNEGDPAERRADSAYYGSFVVSFADSHEARRFVRAWQKRELRVSHRTATVDVTWLW